MIDEQELTDVANIDLPNALMQTSMKDKADKVIIRMRRMHYKPSDMMLTRTTLLKKKKSQINNLTL